MKVSRAIIKRRILIESNAAPQPRRVHKVFAYPKGVIAHAQTNDPLYPYPYKPSRDPREKHKIPIRGTPLHAVYLNHQQVLRDLPPRYRIPNIRGFRPFRQARRRPQTNRNDAALEVGTEEFRTDIGGKTRHLRKMVKSMIEIDLGHKMDLDAQSQAMKAWGDGEYRASLAGWKELAALSFQVYRRLCHNKGGRNAHASFYLLFRSVPGGAVNRLTHSRGVSSIFIRVKLSSKVPKQKIEILWIAARLAENFGTFKETYYNERTDPWNVDQVTVVQNLGFDYWNVDHIIHRSLVPIDVSMIKEPMIRYEFTALNKFLKRNDLQLTCPRTFKNCFASAILLSEAEVDYNDLSFERNQTAVRKITSKKSLTEMASRMMRKAKLSKGVHRLDELVEAFNENNVIFKNVITIYSYDLTKLGIIYPQTVTAHTKGVDIIIYGGHAYAVIKRRPSPPALKASLIKSVFLRTKEAQAWGVYDIETTTADTPYLLGYLNPQMVYMVWRGFQCVVNFLLHLIEHEKGQDIYAHNGGKFDIGFIEDGARSLGDRIQLGSILEHNGRILTATYSGPLEGKRKRLWKSPDTFTFKDSYPYILMSLDKAGKLYEAKHQKLTGKVDHKKVHDWNWREEVERQGIAEYLNHDVLCLAEVLIRYRDETISNLKINPLANALTRAGVSRKIFLGRYYDPSRYPLYLLPDKQERFLKKAYHGGRAQNFVRGEFISVPGKQLYFDDFRSLYPSVMLGDLPWGKPIITPMTGLIPGWDGFIEVDVRGGREDGWNPLRYHHPTRGLIDPVLTEWTRLVFSSRTIEFAMDPRFKYEFRFIKGYRFEMGPWLADCVRALYTDKERLESLGLKGGPAYNAVKQALNSLYGFFGMKMESTAIIRAEPESLLKIFASGNLRYYNETHKLAYIHQKMDVKLRSTAVAAWVTALAHIKLMKLLLVIEDAGGTALYCDTDSVLTDVDLPIGPNIGDLSYEVPWPIHNVVIVAPKIYAIKAVGKDEDGEDYEDKIVCKGVSVDLVYEDIVGLLHDRPIKFTPEVRFMGGKRQWATEDLVQVHNVETEIKIEGVLLKGKLNGVNVLPLHINKNGLVLNLK